MDRFLEISLPVRRQTGTIVETEPLYRGGDLDIMLSIGMEVVSYRLRRAQSNRPLPNFNSEWDNLSTNHNPNIYLDQRGAG